MKHRTHAGYHAAADQRAAVKRHVVAKLARKRPSPILSGRAPSWAGAVIYALGQVNFLFDSTTKPYATADDLSAAFGVSKSTLGNKAKQVRDFLKMDWGKTEFLREDMIEANPMVWFIRVDGIVLDARHAPPEIQLQALVNGFIPYIPALGRDGTAGAQSYHHAADRPAHHCELDLGCRQQRHSVARGETLPENTQRIAVRIG